MLQKIGNCFGVSLKKIGIVLEIPVNCRNGSELILLFWDILENLRNSSGHSWKIWGIALGSSQKAQIKRLRHNPHATWPFATEEHLSRGLRTIWKLQLRGSTSLRIAKKRTFYIVLLGFNMGNIWNIPSGYVKIAIENGHRNSFIVDFPMKHGDFPSLCDSLPEGMEHIMIYEIQLFQNRYTLW